MRALCETDVGATAEKGGVLVGCVLTFGTLQRVGATAGRKTKGRKAKAKREQRKYPSPPLLHLRLLLLLLLLSRSDLSLCLYSAAALLLDLPNARQR